MKKLILIASLSFIAFASKAQTKTPVAVTDSTVFTSVEEEPTFPGGIESFYRYLGMTVRYPRYSREHNVQGRVIIQFIIEKDGHLSNFQILYSPAEDLSYESLRVMKECRNWIPGKQNGKPVRVRFTFPINFQLQESIKSTTKPSSGR